VRAVETEGPVDRAALRRIVAALMAERLDRARPLWAIDLVERLDDGSAAVVWRVHHCMADGLTAFRLGSAAIWTTDPEPARDVARWHPEPGPGTLALVAAGARDRMTGLARDVASAAGFVRSPRRLGGAVASAARMPAVLARELAARGSETALDVHPSRDRAVATATAPLARLKQIEHAAGPGITVNDVVLAAVGGGLRRWLEHRGEGLEGVRAKVPVSLHRQDPTPDAIGNHDSFMFVDLAVAETDPVERLRDVNRETVSRKVHRDPAVIYDFFRDVHAVPALGRVASRRAMSPGTFTLSVSNCPGPASAIYVLGNEVSEFYSFAEIADRHGLRVAVVSVAGTVSFGLCADRALADELGTLAAGIETELDELAAAVSEPS
jgi:WS/DGAT/MGAT family acyltransferase